MTTQELKEYIGRVLGNSIRCLLPSYWWKRLFGLVVDKVEDVEGKIEKEVPELIESSLAEFAKKFPDIESRTFYIQGNHEHNLSLLLKIGEEYQTTGLVKQLYLAYYVNPDDDGFIVISPQFGIFDERGYAFFDVVTPYTRTKQDVIIKQDGSVEIVDAFYLGKTDTELSATSIFPLANYALTQRLWKKVSVIEISSVAHYSNKEIYNKLDTGFVPTVICKNRSEYTSSDKLIYQVSYCETFGSTKRLWAYLFNMGEGAGIEGSINSHAYIIIDLDSEGITTIVKEGVISSSGSSYDDTELKKQLNTKQDKITDLETIRSGAALGATALQEHQDISHLATKDEVTNLINEMVANEEVHAAAYTDLDSRLKDIGSLISGVAVTKEEFQEGLQNITNEVVANEEVTAAALNDLNERINAISENVSGETATKVELEEVVESINAIIIDNEEVHAAALNELNARINDMALRLKALENVNN